jgi:hypothetical protein
MEDDIDSSAPVVRKGILESVGDEFIHNQPDRDCPIVSK